MFEFGVKLYAEPVLGIGIIGFLGSETLVLPSTFSFAWDLRKRRMRI